MKQFYLAQGRSEGKEGCLAVPCLTTPACAILFYLYEGDYLFMICL